MQRTTMTAGFAIAFAVVAGLAMSWMAMSSESLIGACLVAAVGGAVCGYLLSDKDPQE